MRFYVDGKRIPMSRVLKAIGLKEFRRIITDTKHIYREFPEYTNKYLIGDKVLTVRI